MSKEVTIPTCHKPFTVSVNGKKYTYEPGQTVDVPDEVAAVIMPHIKFHEEKENFREPSSGGCSDSDSGSLFRTVSFLHYAISYIDENMQPGYIAYVDSDENGEPIPTTVKIFGGVFVCQENLAGTGIVSAPCDLWDTGVADCYLHIAEDGAVVH